MEKIYKNIWKIALVVAIMLLCVLATSCSGFKVTPDDDGGITVTPGTGDDPSDVEVHTHIYTTVDSEGTYSCTEDRVIVYRCKCGAEISENIKAPGHDIRSYEGKAATCLEDGYEPYEKCIRGKCTYTTYKAIPALDHNLTKLADVAPTCTLDGAKNRTKCTRSGCDYTTETVVPSLGHIRNRVEGKAATCTQDGYTSYETCSRAGCSTVNLSQPTILPASGHELTHYEAKAPTCTEFGWNAYSVCKKCTYSSYEKLDATGHSYKSGYCSSCGQAEPKHVHTWGTGEISVAATCTTTGTMKYTCTSANCGETKYEEIAAVGHSTTRYPAKNPTCTEDGWYAYEECKNCNYNTYAVAPAMGHSYDSGVVTTAATCTQPGVRTYSCVNGSCKKKVTTEIEKLGHDWGSWYVHTEPTCDSVGQERRICFNDSNHVDNRTLPKLGHDWTEYSVIKNPTCTEEGQKKRTCNNNSAHEEIVVILPNGHTTLDLTGICTVCGIQIGRRLDAPTITNTENAIIMWNRVDGAVNYEVTIDDNVIITPSTKIDLEAYYGDTNIIQVTIRAKAAEGSGVFDSSLCRYTYTVPGEPLSSIKGVGDAVNLLTGTYTEFVGGTTRIWDETLFRRLRADDKTTAHGYQIAEVVYRESLDSYLNHLTESYNSKTNVSASVGFAGIANITAGYSYEVGKEYQKKTQNDTKAVFYDMDYKYIDKTVEIYGYNNKGKLSSMLSSSFVCDARKLQNGEMTPGEFITKYGTHIVTAGTYGAKFNLHYEMLTTNKKAEETFGQDVKQGITANIKGKLSNVDLGIQADSTVTESQSALVSTTNEDVYTKFTATAIGGNATGMMATDLGEFAEICKNWTEGLNETDNYVLIDVPDGSLFFVWDFLGEEFAEAKNMLDKYFYSVCDEQYYSLKNKISSIYQDSFTFDESDGTLTVNLSGLQNYESAKLETLNYKMDGATVFDPSTGVFNVFSKYDGYDVNKVVFIGAYGTEDRLGRLVQTRFSPFCIKFDQGWNDDITIEFVNFAYMSPAGCAALDFNTVGSKNITMIVTGENMLTGGTGVNGGDSGFVAINAVGKNLVIKGSGALEVFGGNGADGAVNGGVGGAGADGIVANTVTVDLAKNVEVSGGAGGNGSEGRTGSHTSNAGNGGNGGNGGMAINCQSLSLMNSNALIAIIGGNGGNGGKGGYIPNGSNNGGMYDIADAGNGGNGGNGGAPVLASSLKDLICSSLELKHGNGGKGGDGGDGGDPVNGDYCPDGWSHGGHGGHGGNGFKAGDGGNGGQGGNSTGHNHGDFLFTKEERSGAGNGGNGGNGGNMVSSVLYVSGVAQSIKSNGDCGKFGEAGSGGIASGYHGVYGHPGESGIDGDNGTTDNSYYIEFEELLQQSVN